MRVEILLKEREELLQSYPCISERHDFINRLAESRWHMTVNRKEGGSCRHKCHVGRSSDRLSFLYEVGMKVMSLEK